jgi:hypothetical protein
MRRSHFCPAPAGNRHADSFRLWEAFEAGCFPLLARSGLAPRQRSVLRGTLAALRAVHGADDATLRRWIIESGDWADAAAAVRARLAEPSASLEARRQEMRRWWSGFKTSLAGAVAHELWASGAWPEGAAPPPAFVPRG